MLRGRRFRLYPTSAQEALLAQFAGVCRLVFNLGLEQRRDWFRQYENTCGRHISFASQSRELTDLRAQFDWIAAVNRTCQEQALRDLDEAFSNFFMRRAKYPRPRRKGVDDSFRFAGRDVGVHKLNDRWGEVWLPKIGWVKYRRTREIESRIRNATVSRDAVGWHVGVVCDVECLLSSEARPALGIDRGIANTLAFSTGEMLSLPASIAHLNKRRGREHRRLARKKRDSARWVKQVRRAARLSARAARIRRDWQHRITTRIARNYGVVVIEALNIRGMMASAAGTIENPGTNVAQKRGLNRCIAEQGWYSFERMLSYKLAEMGGTLIKVNPSHTSQTCSECGCIDAGSRESQAAFLCVECGFQTHADHNAAINILRRSTASMRVEDGPRPAVEARTVVGASCENRAALAA